VRLTGSAAGSTEAQVLQYAQWINGHHQHSAALVDTSHVTARVLNSFIPPVNTGREHLWREAMSQAVTSRQTTTRLTLVMIVTLSIVKIRV